MNACQLTLAIKGAADIERLAELAQKHSQNLNPIHVAAIFRKLAGTSRPSRPDHSTTAPGQPPTSAASAGSTAASQQLLNQLQQLIKQQCCAGHGPRGIANILAAVAKLQQVPDVELLRMLLDSFCRQIEVASPQDGATVLRSAAQITLAHYAVFKPVSHSSSNAEEAQGTTPTDVTTSAEMHSGLVGKAAPGPAAAGAQATAAGDGLFKQRCSRDLACEGRQHVHGNAVHQAGKDQQQQQQQLWAPSAAARSKQGSSSASCVSQIMLGNTARHMQQQQNCCCSSSGCHLCAHSSSC
uniref:Uncharacterized protein n=1 Tax=Tetradesmus obliquus TaxID=3088 RepID=A0A383VW39_TETOB|eukprot:jgi/Sobl393_1/11786/SZX69069.1